MRTTEKNSTRCGRVIAIGDIHGHAAALESLLQRIAPQLEDTIVTLGDYVDGGPDSKGVLDQLIELEFRCKLVPLRGNHEEMMLGARHAHSDFEFWKNCGAITTLDSYGDTGRLDQIPTAHIDFVERCVNDFEIDTHFFIHANYFPNRWLKDQDHRTRFWLPLCDEMPGPHFSGKTAVVGHTPQLTGRILDLGYLNCIDTGCGYGGYLTALDVNTGELWQVNEQGRPV